MNLKLEKCEEIAEGTVSLLWEKPSGFDFEPGQFLEFHLHGNGHQDNQRIFSIASAPSESLIRIATRARESTFKKKLLNLPKDTEVPVEGPMGTFQLHEGPNQPAVFLAGGIGITPFRSMILEAMGSSNAPSMILFYANRRTEDAAFLTELIHLDRQSDRFRLVATMTQQDQSERPWRGETGRINRRMLERHIDKLNFPRFYVAGPPGMVSDMTELLSQAGVPQANLRAEKFAGY
jgi:ferredoxin-NADP reductase